MQNQQHWNIVKADSIITFIESDKALFLVGIILSHIAFFFSIQKHSSNL